jgi:hypothetical protein
MRQRKSDHPAVMLDRLQRRHTDLATRIASIDNQMHLTTYDQSQLTSLKREKLAAKDALQALRPKS